MSMSSPRLDDLRIERKENSKAPRSPWTAIFVVILAVIASFAIWWLKRPAAIEVRTAMAREATIAGADRTVLNASGYVTARRAATVSSKITGKVTEVAIEEGVKVETGQIL